MGIGRAGVSAVYGKTILAMSGPNAFNGEAVMAPIQPYVGRGSNMISVVAQLRHARYLRIDYIDPGEIITLGSDRWKAYPHYRKNAAVPRGSRDGVDSGAFGWAIEYDGP